MIQVKKFQRFRWSRAASTLSILIVGFGAASMGLAQSKSEGNKAKPDEEKRSTIYQITGFAQLGENMTIKMAREAAYLNARQRAVKNAMTMIQAMNVMKDFQITDALVKSYSQGNVRVLEDKDLGIQAGGRYKVWIRAEVSIKKMLDTAKIEKNLRPPKKVVKKEKADKADKKSAQGKTVAARVPLKVQIWTSKKVYRNGEKMKIYLRSNRDFYGKVMYEDATGNIIRLLPNRFREDNYFKANQEYVIPGNKDRFELTVQKPFGRERVTVYASTHPVGDAGGRELNNGMVLVNEKDRKKTALRMRGVKIGAVDRNVDSDQPSEFYEAVFGVRTKP